MRGATIKTCVTAIPLKDTSQQNKNYSSPPSVLERKAHNSVKQANTVKEAHIILHLVMGCQDVKNTSL